MPETVQVGELSDPVVPLSLTQTDYFTGVCQSSFWLLIQEHIEILKKTPKDDPSRLERFAWLHADFAEYNQDIWDLIEEALMDELQDLLE